MTQPKVHLVLFDIDGTLIRTHGAGNRAFQNTIETIFGIQTDFSGVSFWGGTDLGILHETLKKYNVQPTERQVSRFFETLPGALEEAFKEIRFTVLPGVQALLGELFSHEKCKLGLVTGNGKKAAHYKLSLSGLLDFFEFGGFGDDHADRKEIAKVAVSRARKQYGIEEFSKVTLLGDTPNDVQAGKAVGAQSAVVATGKYNVKQLLETEADWVFEDFSNTEKVIGKIL